MKITEAYSLFYEKEEKESISFKKQKYRIERFIEFIGEEIDSKEAISSENLISFFNSIDGGIKGYYYTLKNFYNFINKGIYNLPQGEVKEFPIEPPQGFLTSSEKNESKKAKDVFLGKDFDFSQIFNDEFYLHLNNPVATCTLKAAFALGLGAAYSSNHITEMNIDDVVIDEEIVKIKNVYNKEKVPYIILKSPFSTYIQNYFDLRMKKGTTTNLFFIKIWDGRTLEIDKTIKKPDKPIGLANYILKDISYRLDIEPELYFGQLHKNGVAHYLFQSNGQALGNILQAFGIESKFITKAYNYYLNSVPSNDFIGFNPFDGIKEEQEGEKDFFPEFIIETKSDDEVERINYMRNLYKRDSKIVRELKKLYENRCQICGENLIEHELLGYSEVNHIQPLSKGGPDTKDNMIVLCPNHHKLMDIGIITIDPDDLETIYHIDTTNSLHLKKLNDIRHALSKANVLFHYEKLYRPMYRLLNRNNLYDDKKT